MKKYSFLVYHTDYLCFLNNLQENGVVHIIDKNKGDIEEESIREKYVKWQNYRKTIQFFKKREPGSVNPKEADIEVIYQEYVNFQLELETVLQKILSAKKELDLLGPWGDFNWDIIGKLKEAGIFLRFFTCPVKLYDPAWETSCYVEVINQENGLVYFVCVVQNEKDLPIIADEIKLPEKSLSFIVNEMKILENQVDHINRQLDNMAVWYLQLFERQAAILKADIDFDKVVLNTTREAENKLMILEGWVPEEKEPELLKMLGDQDVFYLAEKAQNHETPPVLLKNNRFARLYEPIGELYTFPDYKELDLTPFFAPFFMMFFGFCLGDAGYGLLILIAAIYLRKRVKPVLKPVITLGIFLGSATIIMGIISGTLFGISLLKLSYPWMSGIQRVMLDIDEMMLLSLAVGFVQTIFGMAIKAVNRARQFGFQYALSTVGWIIFILGTVVIYGLHAIKKIPLNELTVPVISIAVVSGFLIFFLNSPGKNIFLNVGLGVWDTYNMASGLLGDLLSYIRLFALGISSAVLGNVFNDLAFDLSPEIPVVRQLVILLILLFGHGLNLFMSALGSFVHPLRLTFVEFYKNAGFSGGGKKYDPFRKTVRN